VLDLAAGTGKLTRELVPTGAEVVAVEPVEGMRAELAEALPAVRALAGTAERIPLPDAAVDAVTVAQAFHWFDGPAALAEIHRVLAGGGRLGLLWNVMDREVAWVDAVQRAVHAHRGESPWYTSHRWQRAFEGRDGFGPLEAADVRNVQVVDPEGVVERVASVSFIATLEPAANAAVLDEIRSIVAAHPETRGKRTIEIPYRTEVFWCERRS
jgi:SAM-dependent methyltransferase